MELKDFVKETIQEIADAVVELNGDNNKGSLLVNPAVKDIGRGVIVRESDENTNVGKVVDVSFDVEVSVAYDTSKSKSGGIKIYGIGFGANNENNDATSNVNHLKFTLPVLFPYS